MNYSLLSKWSFGDMWLLFSCLINYLEGRVILLSLSSYNVTKPINLLFMKLEGHI